MMAGVGSWLLSITGASVLCALADGLMAAGPVRRVGRLVCGLMLLAVILAPLAQLDLEGGQRWLEEYHLGLEDRTQELERQVDEQMKTIIEQEYAAYIVDKAAELGLTCTAPGILPGRGGGAVPTGAGGSIRLSDRRGAGAAVPGDPGGPGHPGGGAGLC